MNNLVTFPSIHSPSSVLVIDDNLDEQLLMQSMLRRHLSDVWPVGAMTAGQALAYLTDCLAAGAPSPSLILLDLYLPRREDGWALLRSIRDHAVYQGVPVVIISRSTDRFDIEQSYRRGANSYISKPITIGEWADCFRMLRHYWWHMATLPEGAAA